MAGYKDHIRCTAAKVKCDCGRVGSLNLKVTTRMGAAPSLPSGTHWSGQNGLVSMILSISVRRWSGPKPTQQLDRAITRERDQRGLLTLLDSVGRISQTFHGRRAVSERWLTRGVEVFALGVSLEAAGGDFEHASAAKTSTIGMTR